MGIKGDKLQINQVIDSTDNNNIEDVIGRKDDTVAGNSLVSLNKIIDANVDSILADTANLDKGLVVAGNLNILYPDVDQPSSAIEFTLINANDGYAEDAEITDVGQIDIYRFRKGTDAGWTQIVNAAAPAGTNMGTLNYSYAFPNASWARGDMVQVHLSSVEVTVNTKVVKIPRVTAYAVLGLNSIIQDLVDGGRIDLLIDAIKAKTDLLGLQPQSVSFSAANLPQSTQSTLFVVTGKVLITQIVGEVTTEIQAQDNNTKLIANPSVGADVDLCAVLNINADTVGTIYTITGTLSDALVATPSGAVQSQLNSVIVAAGTIDLYCAASNTGQVKWTLHYIPLDSGSSVSLLS